MLSVKLIKRVVVKAQELIRALNWNLKENQLRLRKSLVPPRESKER